MTPKESFHHETNWYKKCLMMEIFHLGMKHHIPAWTITQTAEQFGVSIALTSENLRIAQAIHLNEVAIMKCKSRQEALKKLNNRFFRGRMDETSGPHHK